MSSNRSVYRSRREIWDAFQQEDDGERATAATEFLPSDEDNFIDGTDGRSFASSPVPTDVNTDSFSTVSDLSDTIMDYESNVEDSDEFYRSADEFYDSTDDVLNESISSNEGDVFLDDRVDRVSLLNDSNDDDGDELHPSDALVNDDIMSVIGSGIELVLKVAAIAIFFKLPNTVVNAILALLRYLGHDVPKDARTIKKTPRNGPLSDTFHHFGLKKNLISRITADFDNISSRNIKLHINIDGVPLFKSCNTVFWPILCSISNSCNRSPFVVSVFCGICKPDCLESYLNPFLDEMVDLETNGLYVNEVHFRVSLEAVICDAPARSFIKCTINHNGTKGCERCTVVAKKLRNRMSFIPNPRFTRPRTDKTFRDQQDKDHHKGKSPFEKLNIDMIKSFPLDYMHLALLGVMKRLILNWVGGKKSDPQHKLGKEKIEIINSRIKRCSKFFPAEFNRKGREIDDFRHWKAVEFRSFLLYSGVVVLKDVLPEDKYDNFLLLHVAFRILLSPNCTLPQIGFASRCLLNFVASFQTIYGKHNVVFCVHNLIHISEDCLHFGKSL